MRSCNGSYRAVNAQSDCTLDSAKVRKVSVAQRKKNNKERAVLMMIRVATAELAAVRRALHQFLGPSLDIYTAVIDNKHGTASLQVELAAPRVGDAMTLIMSALPEAEFGAIRPSSRALAH
jgi:hypothetical protein